MPRTRKKPGNTPDGTATERAVKQPLLDRVLFVRCDQRLVEALERLRAQRLKERPGSRISTAEVVRELLWEGILRSRGQ